jgi:hypothetical protein
MTDDLIKRLRRYAGEVCLSTDDEMEAADALAAADADLAAARAALVEVLDWTGSDDRDYPEHAHAIAAARGEKFNPVKSCETCRFTIAICGYSTCIHGCGWQPKSYECPTCGKAGDPACATVGCPDCGKKETK